MIVANVARQCFASGVPVSVEKSVEYVMVLANGLNRGLPILILPTEQDVKIAAMAMKEVLNIAISGLLDNVGVERIVDFRPCSAVRRCNVSAQEFLQVGGDQPIAGKVKLLSVQALRGPPKRLANPLAGMPVVASPAEGDDPAILYLRVGEI